MRFLIGLVLLAQPSGRSPCKLGRFWVEIILYCNMEDDSFVFEMVPTVGEEWEMLWMGGALKTRTLNELRECFLLYLGFYGLRLLYRRMIMFLFALGSSLSLFQVWIRYFLVYFMYTWALPVHHNRILLYIIEKNILLSRVCSLVYSLCAWDVYLCDINKIDLVFKK